MVRPSRFLGELAGAGADRGGTLKSELDLLVDRGIITRQLRENADEVRLSGNVVAHPEELGEASDKDAEDSLVFLDNFVETTLAIPARQRRRREERSGSEAVSAGDADSN